MPMLYATMPVAILKDVRNQLKQDEARSSSASQRERIQVLIQHCDEAVQDATPLEDERA